MTTPMITADKLYLLTHEDNSIHNLDSSDFKYLANSQFGW